MKYSIILPVYNVANFLPDCINSCLSQQNMTLGKDYELIFVNDGSTDKSKDIIQNMCPVRNNSDRGGYVLVNQYNKGVSSARNTGLDHARGEYIWFVDPDDFIADNALWLIDEKLRETENPIIVDIRSIPVKESQTYSPQEVNKFQQLNSSDQSTTAISLVVKREYLLENKIVFEEKMAYGEDTLWVFWVKFFTSKDIPTVKPYIYFYRQREGSAMHSKDPKRIDRMLESSFVMLETYIDVAENRVLDNYQKKHIGKRIVWSVQNVMFNAVRLDPKQFRVAQQRLTVMGVYPYPIDWSRLSFKYGRNNFIVTLIGFFLKYRPYAHFLNFIYNRVR